MLIIGLDYHPSFQQIAFVDNETGEYGERGLLHQNGEAERFYRELKQRGVKVRIGMEATGHSRWFERLIVELDFELWIGDPAQIKAKRVRKQKTDREDARLLLTLLMEDRFPRIWVPGADNRDLRQLLWHRHRLVQMRTRIMNQLQAVAMNEGIRRKKGLWSNAGRAQLESFSLAPWAAQRRQDLLELIEPQDRGVNHSGKERSRENARGAAVDDPSWSGRAYCAGVRAHPWDSAAFPMRQTDCQLSGIDSLRGL